MTPTYLVMPPFVLNKDFIDQQDRPFGVPTVDPSLQSNFGFADPIQTPTLLKDRTRPPTLFYPDDLSMHGSSTLRAFLRFDVVDYSSAKLESSRNAFNNLNNDVTLDMVSGALGTGIVSGAVGYLLGGKSVGIAGAQLGAVGSAILQGAGVDVGKVIKGYGPNSTALKQYQAEQEFGKVLEKGLLANAIKTVETGLKDRKISEPILTICLPEPDSLEYGYSTKYADTDMTSTQRALDVTKAIVGGAGGSGVVSNTIKELGISNISDLVKRMGQSVGIEDVQLQKLVRASTRMLPNPTLEYLFEGINRRTFDFSFKFYPKSRDEVRSVYEILQAFKKYSLPSNTKADTGGFYLEFPKLFKITHQFYDHNSIIQENKYLPQMKLCALEDVKVNYTETGRFSLFDSEVEFLGSSTGRAPVGMSLQLVFKETELVTANDISSILDRPNANTTPGPNTYH